MFPGICRACIRLVVWLFGEHLFKVSLGQILMADDGAASVIGVEIRVTVKDDGAEDDGGGELVDAVSQMGFIIDDGGDDDD